MLAQKDTVIIILGRQENHLKLVTNAQQQNGEQQSTWLALNFGLAREVAQNPHPDQEKENTNKKRML